MSKISTELPLNIPAGVMIKTTCVDYPGHVAVSFFLKGCNLCCPYCYNTGLVINQNSFENYNTIQELFDHLEKRQGVISALTISGGEPLLSPYTKIIIKKARSLGYKIKLDTNGTLPDQLSELIHEPELRPDFIAMDLKASPNVYATKLCKSNSQNYNDSEYFESALTKSIKLICEYSPECREWRTVLVPGLIDKDEIVKISSLLPKDASWQFSQFQNGNCINPKYNDLQPYSDSEVNELITVAKSFIKNSFLR